MSVHSSDTASVVERTRPVVIGGGGIVAAHFLGRTAAFVLGEEAIVLVASDGDPRRVTAHSGAILTSAADSGRIITGGDDSKLVLTDATGESRILATDPKHRWIDQVALGPDGAVGWSAGKTAYVQ
ncbi:MAG TPA: WD40 repeat domain-containing protein, partial [Xanthobacteraceae bacterium]|nr:WD40 repeat domain-containing protein [Xanthobacteraceae bacterium]